MDRAPPVKAQCHRSLMSFKHPFKLHRYIQLSCGQTESPSYCTASWKLVGTCNSIWPQPMCTWDDLRSLIRQAHIHKQVVWPPNASRRKFIVSVLHVHKPALKWLFCDLHLLAIPFGHPLQVCVCKLAFPNL